MPTPPNRPASPTEFTPDYNAVGLSEFKKNPGKYLLQSDDIPVAIFRHNRIAGWLLTLNAYNNILERNRRLTEELAQLNGLLDRIAPGVLQMIKLAPDVGLPAPAKPKWPIFGEARASARVYLPKPLATDERIRQAIEYGQAYTDAIRGRSEEGAEDYADWDGDEELSDA